MPVKDEWDCQRATGQWVPPVVHKLHDEGRLHGFHGEGMTLWLAAVLWADAKNNMPDVSGGFQTSFWTTCQRNAAGWPNTVSVFEVASLACGEHSDPQISPVTSLFLSSSYKPFRSEVYNRNFTVQGSNRKKAGEVCWLRCTQARAHWTLPVVELGHIWPYYIHIKWKEYGPPFVWFRPSGLPRICWVGQFEYGKQLQIFVEPYTYNRCSKVPINHYHPANFQQLSTNHTTGAFLTRPVF